MSLWMRLAGWRSRGGGLEADALGVGPLAVAVAVAAAAPVTPSQSWLQGADRLPHHPQANFLNTGVLQLAAGTHVVVDETSLESGRLVERGLKNLKALQVRASTSSGNRPGADAQTWESLGLVVCPLRAQDNTSLQTTSVYARLSMRGPDVARQLRLPARGGGGRPRLQLALESTLRGGVLGSSDAR